MQIAVRALKPLTPKQTRKKLRIVSAKEEAAGALTDLVEPSQLERRFGGGASDYIFDPEVRLGVLAQ